MNIEQKKEYAKNWEKQLEAFKPILIECFKEAYIGDDYRSNLNDEEVNQKIERIEDVINNITYVFGSSNHGKFEYISSTNEERIKNDEQLLERIDRLTDEEEALVFPKTQPSVIAFNIDRGFNIRKIIHEINHTLHNKEVSQMEAISPIMAKYLPKKYQEGISNEDIRVNTSENNLFYEIINECITGEVVERLKNKIPNYPMSKDDIAPIYVALNDMLNNVIGKYYEVKKDFIKDKLLKAEGNIIVDEIEENTGYKYNDINESIKKLYEMFNQFMLINQNNPALVGKSLIEQEEVYKELFAQSAEFETIVNYNELLSFEDYVNKLKNNIGSY